MKIEIIPYDENNRPIPQQANTDEQVISLWLHNRPKTTQRVYINDMGQFLTFVHKNLPQTILADLQAYSDSYDKSLLQFSIIFTLSICNYKVWEVLKYPSICKGLIDDP